MIHEISFDGNDMVLNGSQLGRLVEVYLTDVARRNQPKTVDGYRFKLRPFLDWWQLFGPAHGWMLHGHDLAEFEQYLSTLPSWGWNSRNDSLRRLRQVFRWAHRRGYISVDFSVFVPTVKGAQPAKEPVELSALSAMLDACWRMSYSLRNRCVIATLAGTGLRREECASLRIESVTIMAGGSGYLAPSVTKNDKPRLVAFDAATGEYIKAWLDALNQVQGPLFPSRSGGRSLSPDGIYKIVMDAANMAGVNVQTHDLRRMFATVWSKTLRGESYGQLLQKQLGHADYNTTALYSLQDISDVLDVLRKESVSPIAQLSRK